MGAIVSPSSTDCFALGNKSVLQFVNGFSNGPFARTATNGPFAQSISVYVGATEYPSSIDCLALENKSLFQFLTAFDKRTICKDCYKWTICKALLQMDHLHKF